MQEVADSSPFTVVTNILSVNSLNSKCMKIIDLFFIQTWILQKKLIKWRNDNVVCVEENW